MGNIIDVLKEVVTDIGFWLMLVALMPMCSWKKEMCIRDRFCFVVAAVASIFKPGLDFSAAAFTIAAVTVLAVILQALCYPFIFKVGVEKGRITSVLTIGLVVAAGTFLLVSSDGGSNGLLNKMMNAGSSLNSLLLVLAAAILWYMSMTLSMVFYNKREL